MRKAYFTLGFLLGLIVTSSLFAFLKPGNSGASSDVRRLKVSHGLPTNHPIHAGIESFAERVAYYSSGRLQFDVFPNAQLGSGTQTLEQMQAGTLDAAQVGAASLGSFIPEAKVFSLPYLFRSSDHYWAVLNGEIGQELLDALAINASGNPSGFRGLTYYDAGSRNFYAKKAIQAPSDLKGMKIRVMNDSVAIDTMKALGASPTPISWGELYTSLQQGVVDGAENNPPSFVSSRHFEVCKEFSFDHHSRIPDILFISEKTWNSLTPEERGWIQQAAIESTEFERKVWDAAVVDALSVMREQGVTIHEASMEPFMQATEAVREKYAVGELKDLVHRIQQVSE
ncbi:TRAP transporter substrate-binding protein [Coraliomargarita parva]|uniref:TRAP transporter substrate-binding protein n=1 Tax=Coraliomargarita parva TaxID=3014050 RepID=UPI0022B301E2|nr:TRAP transporter substrate-binding protein [Coraliomargarita parva]